MATCGTVGPRGGRAAAMPRTARSPRSISACASSRSPGSSPAETRGAPLLKRVLTTVRIVAVVRLDHDRSVSHQSLPCDRPGDRAAGPGVVAGAGRPDRPLGATIWAARRAPAAGFGALWFWITLAPSIAVNLLPLPSADHGGALPLPPHGGLLARPRLGRGPPARPAGVGTARLRSARSRPSASRRSCSPTRSSPSGVTRTGAIEYRLYSRMVETEPAAAMPHLNLAVHPARPWRDRPGQPAPARGGAPRAREPEGERGARAYRDHPRGARGGAPARARGARARAGERGRAGVAGRAVPPARRAGAGAARAHRIAPDQAQPGPRGAEPRPRARVARSGGAGRGAARARRSRWSGS